MTSDDGTGLALYIAGRRLRPVKAIWNRLVRRYAVHGTRLAPSLDVPMLVLHGSEVPEAELKSLLAALADADPVSLPGAGHMLPTTDGRFVVDHVARWVSKVGHAR